MAVTPVSCIVLFDPFCLIHCFTSLEWKRQFEALPMKQIMKSVVECPIRVSCLCCCCILVVRGDGNWPSPYNRDIAMRTSKGRCLIPVEEPEALHFSCGWSLMRKQSKGQQSVNTIAEDLVPFTQFWLDYTIRSIGLFAGRLLHIPNLTSCCCCIFSL